MRVGRLLGGSLARGLRPGALGSVRGSAAIAPGHFAREWSRPDLQKVGLRPLPEGVSVQDLCPRALTRDILAYGTARDVWTEIYDTACKQKAHQIWRTDDLQEFGIDNFLERHVLRHRSLACGLAECVGGKLAANSLGGDVDFKAILLSAFKADPEIVEAVACDIKQFRIVDPATSSLLGVYLFYKGVQAMCCARVAHHFYTRRGDAGTHFHLCTPLCI